MKGRAGFTRIVSTPPALEFWSVPANVRTFPIPPAESPGPFPKQHPNHRRRRLSDSAAPRYRCGCGTENTGITTAYGQKRKGSVHGLSHGRSEPQPGLAVSRAMPIFQFNSGRKNHEI